jgi:branched-subunit amino acid aminotransferase/4-amino-4-deoxychorismate lyase
MLERAGTIPTYILTAGVLQPTPYRVRSLAEGVTHEPPGVYTVARTFHGRFALLLDAHLDRLEESARLSGIVLDLDRRRLRAALRDLINRAGFEESKFRITVPREAPENTYLALEPLQPVSPALLERGVAVITVPIRRANPVVKTTDWMAQRRATYDSLPDGVYEGIMCDERGCLLEGLSSNFYGVLSGALRTAGDGVLAGITRKAIFEIAPTVLPLELDPVSSAEIADLSEAMLSSSSRGILPITVIDGRLVGSGQVGPVVTALRRRYEEWAEAHLELI